MVAAHRALKYRIACQAASFVYVIPAIARRSDPVYRHNKSPCPNCNIRKIRIGACFVYSTPIKSCLNILDGGSQLEQIVLTNPLTSEGIMLRTDITILEQRRKVLAKEVDEALSHVPIDDLMITYLKSRILYVKEEIDRLRHEALVSYH